MKQGRTRTSPLRAWITAAVLTTAAVARAETLSLEDAIHLAQTAQPSLRGADAQIRAATARIGRAFAGYLPSINLTLQERWDISNTAVTQVVDPAAGSIAYSYPLLNGFRSVLSASLDERLFDFGRTGGAVATARANENQIRTDRSVLALDVALAVFEAYTDALRGRALARVQQLGIEQVEQQLRRARALFAATLRPEIDVLSAETQLAQARIRLLQARNQEENALVSLRAAIGHGAPAKLEPVDGVLPPLEIESLPAERLRDQAYARRGELRSLEWRIQSAIETLRQTRADYFPVFSLSANASTIVSDLRFGPTFVGFGAFTIQEPVFSGWATRRATQEARANIDAARENLEVQRLRIDQEVGAARLAVELARASLGVAEVARKQAERQLALAQARYESKVGSFVELNDARNGLVTAMAQEVDARYTLSKSRGQLLRRVGQDVLAAP